MRDEAAAEVTKVKVEQRRLEALTAGDLKQLHELHEERVAHLERMVSKPVRTESLYTSARLYLFETETNT